MVTTTLSVYMPASGLITGVAATGAVTVKVTVWLTAGVNGCMVISTKEAVTVCVPAGSGEKV